MRKSLSLAALVCLIVATATLLAGAFVFVDQTQAAINTYYVATSGNDSNPGTASQPWKTIQHAASSVNPGDTVVVQAGTYNERVTLSRSGSSSAYINFKADPARSVNMNGFNLNSQYVKVEGFKVSGAGDIAFAVNASNLIIENNEIIENRSMGVGNFDTFANYSNVVVKNNYIYRSAYGVWAVGQGWTVEGNEVERLIAYDDGDNDYMRFFGSNHVFKRNYLHGTRESEICRPGWTGPFNPSECAHVDGFQTYNNNGEVVRNITFDGNFVSNFHQGVTAQNNSGNRTISGLVFRNNIFWGGTSSDSYAGWGLDLRHLENTIVEHNYFINVGSAVGMGGTNTGIIRNNIFNGTWSVPYEFDGQNNTTAVKGGNNIIYKSNQSVWCWQCGSVSVPLAGDSVNSSIKMINPDSPLGADGKPFTADDGYHLQSGSPAIDAGQTSGATADIFGNARPSGVKVDVGPHEFGAATSNDIPAPPSCTPNWSCSSWNTCNSSGSQSRTCTDLNSCGVTAGKPAESQSCTPPALAPTSSPVSYSGKLVRLICGTKGEGQEACRTVYYVGKNGKRYAFPNEKIFKTWYVNFKSVQVLKIDEISKMPLGGVVTNRPGIKLVKFDTDAKVYAVSRGGVLRWVKSEATAKQLYGDKWNKQIDDIPAWLFPVYTFGLDIDSSSDYNPSLATSESNTIDIDKNL